jgi:hypothetical protein
VVLGLGNRGLLPDRILSQSLEIISRPDAEESSEARSRNQLLDDLTEERVRVGEFIEQWHELDSREAAVKAAPESGKKPNWRDQRSRAEVLGLPLYHKAWGQDPATGKERIATGVVALGNISIGVVALGRWMAVGVIAISPVSIGLWALGLLAIGFKALAPLALSLTDLQWWQALLVVLATGVAGGFLFSRRKPARDAGRLHQLALFSLRSWNEPGAPVQGGKVLAICGRYVVDLTHARLMGERIEIEADAFLGVVRVLAPPGWRVSVAGTPLLGSYTGPSVGSAAGPVIVVRGAAVLGAVQARQQQA